MDSLPQNGQTAATNNPLPNSNPLPASLVPLKLSKTDFFVLDRPTDPFKKLWCKNSKLFPNNMTIKPPRFVTQFMKLGKKLHFLNTRSYFITDDYIYYKKKPEAAVKGAMNYEAVICVFIEPNKKNGEKKRKKFAENFIIQFQKNHVFRELILKDPKIFTELSRFLRMRCILTTFHEEFTVIKGIGKGSFAKVYLARRNSDNNYFAVKCFKKDFILTQQKGKESLLNEISIMRKCSHPSLIKIYEVYESENSIYMVLELLEGGELFARLASKVFYDEEKIAKLIGNLLSALDHLHKKNIMHRDLKPENILLKSKDNDTDIVIADFGLSTEIGPLEQILFKRCGTPGFVGPEVLNFDEKKMPFYNEKCDIFSVGVIFYILLSGKKPFEGKDCKTILRNNKKCTINFMLEEFKKVSPAAMALLKKMLVENPLFRPTAEEALKSEFLKNPIHLNKVEDFEMTHNMMNFQNDYPKALQNKGSDGELGSLKQLYTGSNRFDYKTTGLNGKTETVETLGSNMSINIRRDSSSPLHKIGDKRTSKFSPTIRNPKNSNFSNMLLPSNDNVEDRSVIPSEKKIIKSTRKSEFNTNNDIYKKVLINQAMPNNNRKSLPEENKMN